MSGAPKFTPGPWVVTFRRDGSACISMGGLEPGQQHKQFDLLLRKGESNDEADAALIAAAPDLYAALADLLSAYAEPDKQICCNGQHCGCQGSTVQQMAEHYARAALAKAREQA